MAANTSPIFVLTPQVHWVNVSVANTNRDGATGTYGTGPTFGTNGALLTHIIIHATGNTTAGMVRIFYYDGTNTKLIREVPIPAITASATVPAFSTIVRLAGGGLPVAASDGLKYNTNNAEEFNIFACYGDY